MKTKRLGVASLALFTAALASQAAHAGKACVPFGYNGVGVNWHSIIDQRNADLLATAGLGGTPDDSNICAPAASAHILAGFDDHPSLQTDWAAGNGTGLVSEAGYNDVDMYWYGNAIGQLGRWMGTNRLHIVNLGFTDITIKNLGTLKWDVSGEIKRGLDNSFYNYGSSDYYTSGAPFPTSYSTQFSGLFPSNFTADMLIEPICADATRTGYRSSGAEYDYAKTQMLLNYGRMNISPINVPYPCGDWYTLGLDDWCSTPSGMYTVMLDSGHFVTVIGGSNDQDGPNGQGAWLLIANPDSDMYWSQVSQITVKIAGLVTLFDKAGVVWEPGNTDKTLVVMGYTRASVRHGGTCPPGRHLQMSGGWRGTCL